MVKKKAKKRGVKPGTKRGPYKRNKPSSITLDQYAAKMAKNYTLETIKEFDKVKAYSPSPLTLCGQLEDAILLLENRISNAIAKINSLMG